MPSLTWPSKALPPITPGALLLDSLTYPQGNGYASGGEVPADCLILGDNLKVMAALLPDYAGKVKLIYADPPFFTNRRFPARTGRGEDSRRPQDWQLAEGYPDAWTSLAAYLDMLYPRLALMHQLLAEDGTLYLHLDWHANAYARVLLDEIFGAGRLLNEIIWVYHGPSPIRSAFNRKHDTILVYTKGDRYTFNVDAVRQPYDPSTVKTFNSSPKAGFGKVPDLKRGKVPEDWWYFPVVARLHKERTGYPTQKPRALLERIVLASSNPGDLVADFFCGSGTALAAAARLGRRYLGCDAAWRAVHTARARLVETIAPPFAFYREESALWNVAPGEAGWLRWAGNTVSLASEALPDLDYWELDPAPKGEVFLSFAQAWRPRSGASVPAQLELPDGVEVNNPRARLVRTTGEILFGEG